MTLSISVAALQRRRRRSSRMLYPRRPSRLDASWCADACRRAGTVHRSPACPQRRFLGGVPEGTATPEAITISIADAIARALAHNLGVRQAQDALDDRRREHAHGASAICFRTSEAAITETRRKNSLEAFGFPLGPAFPRVVGPYNVFDARVFATQSLLDLAAMNDARAESHRVECGASTPIRARVRRSFSSPPISICRRWRLRRAPTARAPRLDTAQALYTQAQDLRQSGIVAGLDVVRAEVRLMGDRQRATAAANEHEKMKLQLARVMGLPIGQEYR